MNYPGLQRTPTMHALELPKEILCLILEETISSFWMSSEKPRLGLDVCPELLSLSLTCRAFCQLASHMIPRAIILTLSSWDSSEPELVADGYRMRWVQLFDPNSRLSVNADSQVNHAFSTAVIPWPS